MHISSFEYIFYHPILNSYVLMPSHTAFNNHKLFKYIQIRDALMYWPIISAEKTADDQGQLYSVNQKVAEKHVRLQIIQCEEKNNNALTVKKIVYVKAGSI